MKKLLSVLLVVAVVLGIGMIGARAATWDDWYAQPFEVRMEINGAVRPLRAYHNYAVFFGGYPDIEAERAAALKVPTAPYHNAAFQAAYADMAGGENDHWLENLDRYLNGTLRNDVEQAIASADAYLKEIFSSAYFNQFKAYQAAYTYGENQWRYLSSYLYEFREEIVNYDDRDADCWALQAWINATHATFDDEGTLADFAAYYEELGNRAKAIIDKILFKDTGEPSAVPFWDNWPDWFVWILEYIFFGWLWMRWF